MNPIVFYLMLLDVKERNPKLAEQIIKEINTWNNEALSRMERKLLEMDKKGLLDLGVDIGYITKEKAEELEKYI